MPKINKTKFALLGILTFGPMSGYDIKKLTDFSISHFWSENFGHIYPVLRRMEEEGLVTKEVKETKGKPNRNIYSITEEGRRELAAWLLLPVEEKSQRNELLLKLFFASGLPEERVIEMVSEEEDRQKRLLSEYDDIEKTLTNEESYRDNESLPYWLMTLSYGKKVSQAILEWCEETSKVLKGTTRDDTN